MDINITLIGQMITFAIFVGFTMKFVWPPLRKAMEERKAKIADGLASADRAEKELEVARRKANEVVQEAKAQATKIIEQANMRAMQIDEEAKEAARVDAERIRKAANDEAETQMRAMKQQLRKEVVSIAIQGAEKLIHKNIDMTTNNQLLEEMAAEL
ncbi:F0F1 ATP synthase subunit B [Fangia hongkongensis]|uniref:F0F1 ATP synthase subunit B n=1 Tax=Fangia hongkongensis TaxID=270495 RepID=UPI00037DAF22|nr:F0F1 ATP synthase subunit B [Fangia hongkongensis]MBK2125693.1 F0F1 ATP synthase subunit B [Fangia hongkongensis]